MTKRDLREISEWAFVTAVVVTCSIAGTMAVCTSPEAPQSLISPSKIGACELTGSVTRISSPDSVRVAIRASNTSGEPELLEMDIRLVRREDTGDPMSRVMSPGDTKTAVERVQHVKKQIAANGKLDFAVALEFDGSVVATAASMLSPDGVAAAPVGETIPGTAEAAREPRISYQIVAVQGTNQTTLAYFTKESLPGI